MKKLISAVLVLVLVFFNLFSLNISAVESEDFDKPLVTTDISNIWVTLWDKVSVSNRSIVVHNRGLDENNVNYGNFAVYNEIEVVKPEEYYESVVPVGYRLRKFTDLGPYIDSGFLRFWVDVPKDMSLRISLKSYDSKNDRYSESAIKTSLNVVEGGYQEVEIPLKRFVDANKNWNYTCARYLYIGGVNGCTSETFLGLDEVLKVSHFEIWRENPPEPVEYDATPVYKDVNGRYLIRDVNGILDKDSIVTAFNNFLEKEKFQEAVKGFDSNAEILELYNASVVKVGNWKSNRLADGDEYIYKTVEITDYVEFYIPLTKKIVENYITVVSCVDGVIEEVEYSRTDEYLIINTKSIENILIIDANAPVFEADTLSSENEIRKINDNINFEEAALVKNSVSSGYYMLYNEYSTPLTDITDWLKNENGELRFWLKTPFREGNTDIDFKINISVKYSVGTSWEYPKNSAAITLPADGKWHEIRMASSEFSSTAFDKILNNPDYLDSYNAFYIYISSNTDIKAREGLYFTDFEFYGKSLLTEESNGNVDKDYYLITNLTQDNSWKTGNTTYVTRKVKTSDELPFVKKIVSIDTTESFNIDTYPAGQIGFAYKNGVSCADFAEWVYYNPRAQMRIWVKSEKDVTFVLELHEGSTGKNNTIKATVSVVGSPDWQEVRLNRYDFTTKTAFDDVFVSSNYTTCNVTLFISDIVSGLSAGDNISFAQSVEFFTSEAYSKGDITLSGSVDAADLVRIKKYVAGYNSKTINGDIDADGNVTAIDLAYVRNWIMTGSWK